MPGNDALDINQINRAIRAQGGGWQAGRNPIASESPEERRSRLGATPPRGHPSLVDRERVSLARAADAAYGATADLPQHVDLRDVAGANYVSKVKDQGHCGSCVAFGSIATIESTARLAAGDATLEIDLSEAQLFYCHGASEGRRCNTGWWVDPSLTACRDKGLVADSVFPYTAGDQVCKVDANSTAERYKIVGFKQLESVSEMKGWLTAQGGLAACFSVYEDFYAYKSGVYRHKMGDLEGGHCVSIVGYDETEKCWIAKNSWGDRWGADGFFKIGYGECGVDFEMWGVEVATEDEQQNWLKHRTITGLWVNPDERAAAAFVAGVGWKRLPEEEASAREMLLLLGIARSTAAPVDLRLVDDVIRELYVL